MREMLTAINWSLRWEPFCVLSPKGGPIWQGSMTEIPFTVDGQRVLGTEYLVNSSGRRNTSGVRGCDGGEEASAG